MENEPPQVGPIGGDPPAGEAAPGEVPLLVFQPPPPLLAVSDQDQLVCAIGTQTLEFPSAKNMMYVENDSGIGLAPVGVAPT